MSDRHHPDKDTICLDNYEAGKPPVCVSTVHKLATYEPLPAPVAPEPSAFDTLRHLGKALGRFLFTETAPPSAPPALPNCKTKLETYRE